MTTDEPERPPSIPVEDRPADPGPFHTADLPPTPQRDRAIEATAWLEAPAELLGLADELGSAPARYLRRIGPWLLWRAGPPGAPTPGTGWPAPTTWPPSSPSPSSRTGPGAGVGPSGTTHDRFRSWKEDLRDHG